MELWWGGLLTDSRSTHQTAPGKHAALRPAFRKRVEVAEEQDVQGCNPTQEVRQGLHPGSVSRSILLARSLARMWGAGLVTCLKESGRGHKGQDLGQQHLADELQAPGQQVCKEPALKGAAKAPGCQHRCRLVMWPNPVPLSVGKALST